MELTRALKQINSYIEGCYQQPSNQRQHLSGNGAINNIAEKLCSFYGKKHAVMFCNATTALQAVCLAMELRDTEVLTTPLNWGGSVAPFLLHRNKLRFASFDESSLNISLEDLQFAITNKTKAILSVDYNGTAANSKVIKRFCADHGLKYIADCAQSLGAFRDSKPAGFFADAIVLSFSAGKSFFAGEGGAVITDDETLYEKLIWFSQHPSMQKTIFGISNFNEYAPLNGRMNPLSAILLNEIFEEVLVSLKDYQIRCFSLLKRLHREDLVENCFLDSAEKSTFFNFSFRSRADIQAVNCFLVKEKTGFTAIKSAPCPIPFDPVFFRNFKYKYTCSKTLRTQKHIDFDNYISLKSN